MKTLKSWRKNLPFFTFLLCVIAFRWSFADQYLVPSGSMEPTIHVGDRIFVNKAAYDLKIPFTGMAIIRLGQPIRGDVIVFANPQNGVTMVKRLIGLPGDRMRIVDGFVSVNGRALAGTESGMSRLENAKEKEILYSEIFGDRQATIKRSPLLSRAHDLNFTVPQGKYFVMGDNRDNSADSRSWGFVEHKNLKGRALGVIYNLTFDNLRPRMDQSRIGMRL